MVGHLSMWFIFSIGFLAQILFGLRTAVQWYKSEKAGVVLSPSIYWILSVVAAYLMFIYGAIRDDFSIILGQTIAYYVYIWNLKSKGLWAHFHIIVKLVAVLTPLVTIMLMLDDAELFVETFFRNDKIPAWLVILGSAGQLIFSLRFVYQWLYSKRHGYSVLPVGFWLISLIGSAVIIFYGVIRLDPVLILGQAFGLVAYVRNIMISFKSVGGCSGVCRHAKSDLSVGNDRDCCG